MHFLKGLLTDKTKGGVELVSIHIPKTAGTSFRHTLQSVYGKKGVLRIDIRKGNEASLQVRAADNPRTLPTQARVLHGHFRYDDLKEFYSLDNGIPVITWLRDPVERVISNFFYLQKILRGIVNEKKKRDGLLRRMQRNLTEFAHEERNRNRMSKFLDGLALGDLRFVGTIENFSEDMEALASVLGWKDYKTFEHNSSRKERDPVSDEMREEIKELNSEDVALYREALLIREERNSGKQRA
jgi:hypothetical protein